MLQALLAPLTEVGSALAGGSVVKSLAASGSSFLDVLRSGLTPAPPPGLVENSESSRFDKKQETFQRLLAKFQELASRKLQASGIDVSSPLPLISDGLGGIETESAHPNRDAIESTLNGDETLVSLFRQLQDSFSKLQAMQENVSVDELDRQRFAILLSEKNASPHFLAEDF